MKLVGRNATMAIIFNAVTVFTAFCYTITALPLFTPHFLSFIIQGTSDTLSWPSIVYLTSYMKLHQIRCNLQPDKDVSTKLHLALALYLSDNWIFHCHIRVSIWQNTSTTFQELLWLSSYTLEKTLEGTEDKSRRLKQNKLCSTQ